MSKFSQWLKSTYLCFFSKPAHERVLFRHISKTRPQRFVEIGLGDGRRACRLLAFAFSRAGEAEELKYFGVDWFEAAGSAKPGWSLKSAHQMLKATRASVRLQPGDSFSALSRFANGLTNTDMVIIDADQDPDSLERAWFYLPRILASDAAVFVEERAAEGQGEDESSYRQLSQAEIAKLSDAARVYMERAA